MELPKIENEAMQYFGYPKTQEELKKKMKKLSLLLHPDKNGGNSEEVSYPCNRVKMHSVTTFFKKQSDFFLKFIRLKKYFDLLFNTLEEQESSSSSPKKKRKFYFCDLCNSSSFVSSGNVKRHKQEFHKLVEVEHKCKVCTESCKYLK
jgi:curved DNA-binding protein CbpA